MPYDLTPQPFPFNPTKPSLPHPRFRDLTGKRFGRLVGVHYCGSQSAGSRSRPIWLCRCDCGESVAVESSNLQSGHTSSCGCLHREFAGENLRTHGLTGIPEHRVWKGMLERCGNSSNRAFHNYGGRGITVCARWRESFSNFYADMGQRPSSRHSIDRIDNDGGYEPTNCRWATSKEQAANRRPRASRRQAAVQEGTSA